MAAAVATPPVERLHQDAPSAPPAPSPAREIRYAHTESFVDALDQLGASLAVTTYQVNKLCRPGRGRLDVDGGADLKA